MSKICIYGMIIQLSVYTFALAVESNAQDKSVNDIQVQLNFKSPIQLERVFKEIEKSTDFHFSYVDEQLNSSSYTVSLDTRVLVLGDLLMNISKQTDLSFRRINDNIFIAKKELGVDNVVEEMEMALDVTGKITDESGEPLPGASIIQKGTSNGTISDLEGKYKLSVPEKSLLTISFIGYQTQEIQIGSQSVVDVQMVVDAAKLDEIVVLGYGSVRKVDVTGAVGQVSGTELMRTPSVSVAQTLQGRVPGVQVINSQEPGGSAEIRIRGVSTINNSQPLYVIDGFLTDGMDHLHPSDIKSIEILKDASATSIYGSRGANGVVLITTNSGNFDRKTTVNINSYVGSTQAVEFYDMADATQYSTLFLESLQNAGQTPDVQVKAMMDYIIANNLKGTDWQAEFYQPGLSNNHSINVNGGTANMAYDVSASYARESGIARDGFAEKIFFHANNDYKLSKKVTIGTKLLYNSSGGTHTSPTAGSSKEPLVPAWDSYTNNYGVPFIWDTNNPAFESDARSEYFIYRPMKRFEAKAFLNVDDLLIDGLSFRSQYGISLNFTHEKSFSPLFEIASFSRTTTELEERRSEASDWVWANYFSYNKSINSHRISLTAGMESRLYQFENIGVKVFNVPQNENLYYINSSQDLVNRNVSGSGQHNSMLSFYGRVNYSFKERYLVMLSLRADGSSKFVEKYKWGKFPAFSVGWNLAEEAIFSGISWLDQLKIRGGWGQVGNQGSAGNNDYAALVYNGYKTVFGVNQEIQDGAVQLNVPNRSIHWEVAEQTNIGFDYNMLEGRLSGSFDYFVRDTKDMIISRPIPYYAAQRRSLVNSAIMRSWGYEFNIGYKNSISDDFSYSVSLNSSSAKNEIRNLVEPIIGNGSDLNTITKEGLPAGSFYGLQSNGIIKNQTELDEYTSNVSYGNPGIGDVRFVDQITVDTDNDGIPDARDGIINGDDRTVLGNPWPKFIGGADVFLSFKGFDLGLIFYGEFGKDIWNKVSQIGEKTDMNGSNIFASRMDRWTPENPNSDQPRMYNGDPGNNRRADDRHIVDGSFFRLRNVNLGYNIPSTILDKIKVTNLRVYGSISNVFTLSGYTGLNPEIGANGNAATSSGFDYNMYPVVRTFILGLNIGI